MSLLETHPSKVRSMTGFAAERAQTSLGELSVSLRGVNHRGLDLHFHGGSELAIFENEMRALLKRCIARGHVEVRASITRAVSEEPAVFNREALGRYVSAFRQAASEFDLEARLDLNVLFTIPGIFKESHTSAALPAAFLPEILATLGRCAETFNQQREREGSALRAEMAKLAAEIALATGQIAKLREQAQPYFEERLRTRLSELLAGAGFGENRIVEEAALLADRSDIEEEVVRLGVHTAELQRLLDAGGEIGKRVDFLLQEMNREINTALSKSANAGEPGLAITNIGLAVKANIERIREQGLNLE